MQKQVSPVIANMSTGLTKADIVANLAGIGTQECIPWPYATNTAHQAMYVLDKRNHNAHIELATMKLGPRPDHHHKLTMTCGKEFPACINWLHMAWMPKDYTRQRNRPGDPLDPDKVRKIRTLRQEGRTYQSIAAEFGISAQTAFRVVHREDWAWVA